MPEIGTLVVKLQAQTAQFSSQMRRAQDDIKRLKREDTGTAFTKMGAGASGLRTQLGLLDNTMRHNMPMAMADMIRRFSDSALVMNALPFAATVAGFVMVGEIVAKAVEKIEAMRAAMSKLQQENMQFNTSLADVARGLRERFLQSEEEVDNLTGRHLAALQTELQVINDQKLDNLEASFKSLAKVADQVFKQLHDNWVESWFLGDKGSAPMQKMFEQFQTKYRFDLATKGSAAAAQDLAGMTSRLQTIVSLQKQMRDNQVSNREDFGAARDAQMFQAYTSAKSQLAKMGYSMFGKDELASAEQLLQVLQAMGKGAAEASGVAANHATVARIREQTAAVRRQNEEWRKQEKTIAAIARELDANSTHMAKMMADESHGKYAGKIVPGSTTPYDPYDAANDRMMVMQEKQDLALRKMKTQLMSWSETADAAAQQAQKSFNVTFVGWVNSGGGAYRMLTSLAEGYVDTVVQQGLRQLEAHAMVQQGKVALTASASQQETTISLAADVRKKLSAAKTAAVKAMSSVGFPMDLIVGPLVFASAMAFEQGGKIPGAGAVPIIGHGGETVVTRALTDRVERAERGGGAGGGVQFHYHDNSTHQALDATGMDAVLASHRDVIGREVQSQLRRLNR